MFEDRTYNNIMREMLARMPSDIDTREGSVPYHLLGPAGRELETAYAWMRQIHTLTALPTATGEYLDTWGWTVGLERLPATSAVYEFEYEGEAPPTPGERFFYDGRYFRLRLMDIEVEVPQNPDADDGRTETKTVPTLVLEAEDVGTALNYIMPGTAAVPVQTIWGLKAARFGHIVTPGVEQETDEPYRERIHEKLAGPAENGNRAHYRLWCESVSGVGRAKIVPLFAGENTVLAVLFDPDGNPVTETIADRVQQYIDPITEGVTREWDGQTVVVGDGRGDGKANIGAHFLAVPAARKDITVSFDAVLREGCTLDMVRSEARDAIQSYCAHMALEGLDTAGVTIRLTTIGGLLINLPSLLDYENLQLNGSTRNVSVAVSEAPMLQEVSVREII